MQSLVDIDAVTRGSRSSGSVASAPGSKVSRGWSTAASTGGCWARCFGPGAHARSAVGVSETAAELAVGVELDRRGGSDSSNIPAYGQAAPLRTDTAAGACCATTPADYLDGTQPWVLQGPGHDEMVIVDPGPDDDEHVGDCGSSARFSSWC